MSLLVVGDVPNLYREWLTPLPPGVRILGRGRPPHRAVHLFVTRHQDLARHLEHLRETLDPDGFVWVSWPKRTSGVPSTVTEDVIRAVALPLGFVDNKVCAVSPIWSGLRLVIRIELRRSQTGPGHSLVGRRARRNNAVRSGRNS
jgi:hypothetical protein